jgi:hypothetical protein
MARAAERDGLLASPDVKLAVRWGTRSLLAELGEEKVSAEVDRSEAALRSFYDANRQRYFDEGAARYRQVTYPPGQEKAASSAKKRLRGASLDQLKDAVTVDWILYDRLVPALAEGLRSAPLHKVMGPIRVPAGHMLYEVLDRRDAGPTPFERCRVRVENDMVRLAIKEKLEKLEKFEQLEELP